MKIQLCDCKFSSEELYNFLRETDALFTPPLCEMLQVHRITFADYADKLSKNATIVYAADNDQIVGLIAGYMHNTPDGRSHITLVVVRKEYQGQGLFRRLFCEYEQLARKRGFSALWLETDENNTVARIAYERVGFRLEDGVCNNGQVRLFKLLS